MTLMDIIGFALLGTPLLLFFIEWIKWAASGSPPPFDIIAVSGDDAIHVSGYCMDQFLGVWTKRVCRSWSNVCLIEGNCFRSVKKKRRAQLLTREELRFVRPYCSRPGYMVCVFRTNDFARHVAERAAVVRERCKELERDHELYASWKSSRDDGFVII